MPPCLPECSPHVLPLCCALWASPVLGTTRVTGVYRDCMGACSASRSYGPVVQVQPAWGGLRRHIYRPHSWHTASCIPWCSCAQPAFVPPSLLPCRVGSSRKRKPGSPPPPPAAPGQQVYPHALMTLQARLAAGCATTCLLRRMAGSQSMLGSRRLAVRIPVLSKDSVSSGRHPASSHEPRGSSMLTAARCSGQFLVGRTGSLVARQSPASPALPLQAGPLLPNGTTWTENGNEPGPGDIESQARDACLGRAVAQPSSVAVKSAPLFFDRFTQRTLTKLLLCCCRDVPR